ncbi:hypothetical protein CLV35_0351 [Motilibacter peucedani]|uniref:Helix-turn-helix protein n=1 Tax=Motilibacter peucedani TaxID=598650 RepID=A0A420XSZ9_9ACTN|nr:helix-turn-helix domain-containing protein [Motilibacter peucedani]RKS79934.1 hypothetical protein CLV35_0351 [Motilibacter peucedani]
MSAAKLADGVGDDGSLVVEEQRFAIVPEWVIDGELSDAAFRLYVLLLRYGGSSGCRMPSRRLLAARLHRSVDSVDRAMRELESALVVRVERRHDGRQNLTNRYHLRTSNPGLAAPERGRSGGGRSSAATPSRLPQGGRTGAATPSRLPQGGRTVTATPGRRSAARVAADVPPNPETSTETPPSTPTTPHRSPGAALLIACGISDLAALAAECAGARRAAGCSTSRWTAAGLLPAIQLAVVHRGHPADRVVPALLAVAADPATRSPMRLAEAGPWWTAPPTTAAPPEGDETALGELEARLDDTDGLRVRLQVEARAQLRAEGLALTRATVIRRACQLLDQRTPLVDVHAPDAGAPALRAL